MQEFPWYKPKKFCGTVRGMTEQETPRRGPGRPPKPEGAKPKRNIRIGPIWDEAAAIAEQRGETMTAVIDAALRRYVSRHRHS